MVNVCVECGKPAVYQAITYDGQSVYLCEMHVKEWKVPKLKKLKAELKKKNDVKK
ncbi:MAG: hypothetical protein QXJ02_04680 [Candidatus Bathyarchaeia archaeon]